MSHRCLAAVIAVVALTPMSAAAQSTNTPEPPRTPWGAPDLQGVWDFRTLTPLERPAEFNGKEVLTAEEAADLEQRDAEIRSQPNPRTLQDECPDGFPICSEAPLAYEFRIWFDRGTTVVGSRRTSLIVDPPEGKIPPLTSAAEEKRAAVWETRRGVAFHAPTPGGFTTTVRGMQRPPQRRTRGSARGDGTGRMRAQSLRRRAGRSVATGPSRPNLLPLSSRARPAPPFFCCYS